LEHEDIVPKRTKKEASNSAGSRVRSNEVQNEGNQEHRKPSHAKGKPRNTQLDHPQPAKKESFAKIKPAQENSGRVQGRKEESTKEGKNDKNPKGDRTGHAQNLHVARLHAVQVLKTPDLGRITETSTAPRSEGAIAHQVIQGLGSRDQRSQSLVMVNHATPPINEYHLPRREIKGLDKGTAVVSSKSAEPLLAYRPGYYLSAVAAAAAAAILGAMALVLPGFKRRQGIDKNKNGSVKNRRHRLHVRDWQHGPQKAIRWYDIDSVE
jgi:hypothetical protein